jgi:hypothetical protein
MDLLRHWRRRTFGAAAGALIVPIAIVAAALAVGVGGGGLGGLRSIGQAFNGPKLPDVAPSAARGAAADAGRLLSRVARNPRRGRGTSAGASPSLGGTQVAAAPTTSTGQGPAATQTPSTQTQTQTESTTRPPVSSNPPPAATAAPTQPPVTPAATPTPSVLRQVGDNLKKVTDQVPVAGAPVGGVVDLLVDTVDGLSP